MPSFTYKARNPRGELLTGRLEGGSSDAVADELMRSGLTPVEGKALAVKLEAKNLFGGYFEEKVSELDLMLFSRQMASLLKAGVPVLRARH